MAKSTLKTEIDSLKEQVKLYREQVFCLNNIIQNLPGSIYWKDKHGVYLGVNEVAKEKMRNANLIWNDIIGKTDFDLFPQEIAEQYRKHDIFVMEEAKEFVLEENVVLSNGKTLTQLSSKRPLYNEKGEVIGIIGNTVDITHLKQKEAQLRPAKIKQR
jgi:PAS domain S-box-containing protein